MKYFVVSWGSSVGIVMGYKLVRFLALQDFSLLHSVQSGSGARPTYYPVGTGALSPGVKWQGCEADHSPQSSAKVKNGGAIPPLLHMSSWHNA
jgi:hypothetical protein